MTDLTVNCVLQTGTYSNGTHCVLCEVGHYCPSSSNKPQPCAAGTYADIPGRITCTKCQAGSSCLNPALAPVPCGNGEYSIAGQSTCSVSIEFPSYIVLLVIII